MTTLREDDPGHDVPYATWRSPDPAPDFRARVWQRIEQRRATDAPWYMPWVTGRLAYAGACVATALLWLAILQGSPAHPRPALYASVEPDTLTAALARTVHGR